MSRIVNTGIQQGGVENAVPTAIRQRTMDRLMLTGISFAMLGYSLDRIFNPRLRDMHSATS